MTLITNIITNFTTRAKLAGFLAALMVLALACTTADGQLVQGILQDVDTANGEITIVTMDGKTITLTISTDTAVDTQGEVSSVDTLEPGAAVEVRMSGDGERTTKLSARQAKIEGNVIAIEGSQITIQDDEGREGNVVVIVGENTRIELEEDLPGSLADIKIGAKIEAKFDPETNVAFKIELDQEKDEIEGWTDKVEGNQVTIRTEDGRFLTVTVGENTRIELEEDLPGSLADIKVGAKIEAKFDPVTNVAFKIELDQEKDEIEGWTDKVEGNQVTIRTEDGRFLTVTIGENTRIELEEDLPGSLADIKIGAKIEAKFDPETNVAFEIELDQEKDEIEGWTDKVEGNQVTIRTEDGRFLTVTVGENTRIELNDDSMGTLSDIVKGVKIEADFDPISLTAFKIALEGD
ncbi:MAG: hypothetical protein BZY83_06135 [SAR202 cluster bacterium Casp-Chloro-G2]|nr:MAG: hypothetical protein BZY83_06135 [SAR202 cluster bacterium Casp-Chloro-G2]